MFDNGFSDLCGTFLAVFLSCAPPTEKVPEYTPAPVISSLKPCPSNHSQRYHNCYGQRLLRLSTSPDGSVTADNCGAACSKYLDAGEYSGEFQHDLPDGAGSFVDVFGAYEGEWSNGRQEGQGKYTELFRREGDYEGNWKLGRRYGFGTYRYTDGRVDVGCWNGHELDGPGIRIEIDGSEYEKGLFAEGKLKETIASLTVPALKDMCDDATARDVSAIQQKVAIPATDRIPLKEESGLFIVSVLLDDMLKFDFILDTGATTVSVPEDVLAALKRAGSVTEADMLSPREYLMADGSRVKKQRFLIRKLQVGSRVVGDIEASVSGPRGKLLLGQSVLAKLGAWSIDYASKELLIH